MPHMDDALDGLFSELRRGTLVLGVLAQLRERQYGYSLVQNLTEKGMEVDQGTLYPLLRRLEKQGLLDSDWSLEEARPRRYYVLSARGQEVLRELAAQWDGLVNVIDRLLERDGGERA